MPVLTPRYDMPRLTQGSKDHNDLVRTHLYGAVCAGHLPLHIAPFRLQKKRRLGGSDQHTSGWPLLLPATWPCRKGTSIFSLL